MRALLVQSPAISPWVPRKQWEPPSVAMATIAGQINNHDVRVADAIVWRKQTVPRYLKLLREFRPDVVGFTSMTFQYETSVGLAYLTKQFDSRIRTVLGGYHATLFAENIAAGADAGWWDYLMRGEGDFAFGELLDSIEADGKGMENILGLSYKEEKTFRHNPARPLEDLARIRIPARDKRLVKGFHMYFRRADVIETSRGCLHQCNFCSIHEMYGRSFRLFPLDRVLADIEDAYGRGARHIFCTDDNITLDMDRFEKLCDEVIRLKLKNLMFTTQASPIGFAHRPDLAKKMVQAGFVSIFLGINNVMDQIMTPYPKTPLRGEMIEDKRVVNLSDFRWYDGYFSNVRTRHLTPEELTFVRWKIRREVIGMWRATKADWKHFKGYTYFWEFGFRHIVWLNERLLELLFGIEGRYKLQMRHFLQLNDFGIEIPGRQRVETYHPIYGSDEDPYRDTRWSMLKRRLPFPWRKRLIAQEPS